MYGHTDTITGISLSDDGSYLLSNSIDQTIRCWDVRPYFSSANNTRCVKIFQGHQHNYEKNLLGVCWGLDGTVVCGASSDKYVYIWDSASKNMMHRLGGHQGSVNDVQVSQHGLIATCSTDASIIVGNIP